MSNRERLVVASPLVRLVAAAGLIALAGVGLFPPWEATLEYISTRGGNPIRKQEPLGYRFLLAPPKPLEVTPEKIRGTLRDPVIGIRLDSRRLLVSGVVVSALTAMGMLSLSLLPLRRSDDAAPSRRKLFGTVRQRVSRAIRASMWSETTTILARGSAGLATTAVTLVLVAVIDRQPGSPAVPILRAVVLICAVVAIWLNVTFVRSVRRVSGALAEIVSGVLVVLAVASTAALLGLIIGAFTE